MTAEELRRKIRRNIWIVLLCEAVIVAITAHNLVQWLHSHTSWTLFLLCLNCLCLVGMSFALVRLTQLLRRLKRV